MFLQSNKREVRVWDVHNMSKPVQTLNFDSSSGGQVQNLQNCFLIDNCKALEYWWLKPCDDHKCSSTFSSANGLYNMDMCDKLINVNLRWSAFDSSMWEVAILKSQMHHMVIIIKEYRQGWREPEKTADIL